jgi:small-conductance mechanosensitive channel
MNGNQIGRLLQDLWADLQELNFLWQVAVLAACALAAWRLARLLRWRAPEESHAAVKRGAAAFRRVLFPLVAMLLLYAGRAALGKWHSTNLLSVAIPLFGALAGIRFAVYLLRLTFAGSRWLKGSERAIAALVWGALALHLTGILPEIVELLESVVLSFGKHRLSLWALASTAFWIAVSLLLALWAGSAIEARLLRAEGLDTSLRVVFARLGKAALVVAAVAVVLPMLGVDLTVLSVFGGALGVGLGLGLQKIASNYVSGFIILLDRSIRLGDVIAVNNQYGEVKKITTRYAVVRAQSGVEAIIPNDTLVTTTVVNHSYTDRRVRFALKVPVAYASDIERVLELLERIAARHPRVLREPAPSAQVANLGDNGIELELGFWIDDPEKGSLNVRSELNVAILKEFRAQGIEIPFPRREVRLLPGNSPG